MTIYKCINLFWYKAMSFCSVTVSQLVTVVNYTGCNVPNSSRDLDLLFNPSDYVMYLCFVELFVKSRTLFRMSCFE